ncbi:hypothetical protein BZA77DRAFT_299436 [Pyronema omphalodes]|nr:hypothetical protein BZA77DRAFT_299436 [Pyronema omphalodes]
MSASKAPAVPPTAPVVAGPSSARKQPMRQTRTARKPSTSKPTPNGVESFAIPSAPDKFYSCLHAFTDAIDALPSEIIRHFTLLREVDAKACLPEYHLRTLIDTLDRLPAPADPYEFDAALEALKQLDELRRRRDNDPTFQHNAEQVELLAELEKIEAAEALLGPNCRTILGQPETRRAKCHQIRGQIQDILGTQEEKVHVIGTAVEALNKQMSRVDHAFAYTETEIPQIYRLGNPNHWAYMEPMKKGTAAQIAREKQREQREQEERLHQLAMESNVRGGGRNNNSKNSHHHYAHHQQQEEHEPAKKRVRKTGDNETLSSTKRIVDQQAGAQQQQAKKRKTATTKEDKEKAAAAAAAAKGTASPRASTPVPKKAKTAGQRAPRR